MAMKMKSSFLIIILILSMIIISSESFSQNWPKVYGDNIDAYGRDLLESYDKGYIICGSIDKDAYLYQFGWLIKTDINGNLLWDKKFGDYNVENFFLDFDKTINGGYIIAGGTAQYDVQWDPLFIKLNPCGEIEWCKIFLSPNDNSALAVIALPNGEYLGMLQYYGGDAQHIRISLVKMDASGEPVWIKNLAKQDSIANEEGMYLDLTTDNNFLVSGSCFSPYPKPYFIKTDTAGEELWNIKWPEGFGGYAGRSDFKSNGMIYNATSIQFPGIPKVPYLVKFTEDGEIIDQYQLLGADTVVRGGAQSLLIYDDTTIYTGLTWSDNPSYDPAYCDVIKTDTLGNIAIQRRLINDTQAPTSIIKSFDGKILAIGTFAVDGNWDIYMWKMNTDLEDDTLYTQPLSYDSLCPYEIQSDTVLLDCGLFVNINEIPSKEEYESMIKISPNPAMDWILLELPDNVTLGDVELNIYNIFGQEVVGRDVIPSGRMISLNISSLSSGLYFILSKDSRHGIFSGKFIKVQE
jgi:hypothetical protein